MREKIKKEFKRLCQIYGRKGIIGFSALNDVKLLPIQESYLERKLKSFDFTKPITAISLGVFYTPEEIKSIPDKWIGKGSKEDNWNTYARTCGELSRILNRITRSLTEKFGGVAEQATLEGYANRVKNVEEYFDLCISHRAFAEAAGLGWRGKSGLIVTRENGPALRLSTIFLPFKMKSAKRNLEGCGDCQGCLRICPFFQNKKDYRQDCLVRLKNIGLENEVCGICIRVCWDQVKNKHRV